MGWSVIGEPFWVMCFFSMFAVHMLFYACSFSYAYSFFIALSQNTTTDQCMETGSAEAAQFPVITLPQDVYSDTAGVLPCHVIIISITTHCAIDVLQELANEYNNKPFSLEHSKCNSQYCES